jgi:hypothetical protein
MGTDDQEKGKPEEQTVDAAIKEFADLSGQGNSSGLEVR